MLQRLLQGCYTGIYTVCSLSIDFRSYNINKETGAEIGLGLDIIGECRVEVCFLGILATKALPRTFGLRAWGVGSMIVRRKA